MSLRIGLVAGEHSGDALGAELIGSLKKQASKEISFEGIAGPRMRKAGCKAILPMEKISAGGLTEVLKHLPQLLRARRKIIRYFSNTPPDVFIGIDAPDFNLEVEYRLKTAGIKTVHYVSPSVWAWRSKRIFQITKAVDLMLTLLPFEASFYESHHVPVYFVGHPLADQISGDANKEAARAKLAIEKESILIAVLPGSRNFEIKYLGHLFLDTMAWCYARKPNLRFIIPMVSWKLKEQFESLINNFHSNLPIQIVTGMDASHEAMAASDVVLTASGTATLESLLMNRPMVVAYRLSELTYRILKKMVKVSFCSLPNLLSNRMLVPEFLQQHATPEHLGRALFEYLAYPEETNRLLEEYQQYAAPLKQNASQEAAKRILELLPPL